jgi:UDP-N-acetylmuramoylalanine--D-glutamate ligase
VIGLGNSGINAAALLCDIGAKVRATDSRDTPEIRGALKPLQRRGAEIELGAHTIGSLKDSDLVVVSPGVEDSSPALKWAKELKIPVISELELGFEYCKGRIIAITGTNGKSTVTTLIGEIIKNGGKDTVVCGNIGNSLCGEISKIKAGTWVVIEVSSFQLERTVRFKPHIALILNITDDHLDRYGKFEDYYREKLKIFRNQDASDLLILNHDAVNLRKAGDGAKSRVLFYSRHQAVTGAFIKGGEIFCPVDGKNGKVGPVSDIKLKGIHNVENVLASVLAGASAGIDAGSMMDTVRDFKGLSHRCEPVATIGGVEYIDDSKGTTVDSTRRALESFDTPVILIAGGRDKNSDFTAIRDTVKKSVKHLILIGEARPKIRGMLGDVVDTREAGTMKEAVEMASTLAPKDSVVLLSPMCASFDMFRDYKHRGDVFKEAVKTLKGPGRG